MAAELVQLNPGTQVERWTIVKKLGEGGFGAVYKVSDPTGEYALKVEGVNEQIQVLKMEVFVLNELSKRGNRHFCKIEDKGRFGNFNYVVMTLGESRTAPENGTKRNGEWEVVDYAQRVLGKSLQDLRKRELCRKDDVETWVYMIVELATGNLPWKNVQDMNQVGEYKKRCRQEPFIKELFGGCPREFVEIMQYTDALKYYDAPNYQQIYGLMRRAFTSMGVQEFPFVFFTAAPTRPSRCRYDWEKPAGAF
ncbi:hypothetical protein M3Y99_00378300 [Aphelenchoides fujianensis]|nr:hypothetical protein M3Y99_00378300 [Aphelenchoides fujianensis]